MHIFWDSSCSQIIQIHFQFCCLEEVSSQSGSDVMMSFNAPFFLQCFTIGIWNLYVFSQWCGSLTSFLNSTMRCMHNNELKLKSDKMEVIIAKDHNSIKVVDTSILVSLSQEKQACNLRVLLHKQLSLSHMEAMPNNTYYQFWFIHWPHSWLEK